MIIDAHVHFWKFDPLRDGWINERMKILQKDFLPDHLAPLFFQQEISGCIAVQADQSEDETLFLLSLTTQYEMIKGVVGWIDLKSDDLEEKLNLFRPFSKLKGFRHIAQAEPEGFLLQPDFLRGIRALQAHNYTYDILVYDHQLTDAIQLVEKIPSQQFILDHCAKPNLKTKNITSWKQDLKIIAQNSSILCKLSGLLTEADWFNWHPDEIFRCFDVVFDCFGTDRVVYASDWPVMLLSGNYEQWLQLVQYYTSQFSEAENLKIFSENSQGFYKL